MITIWMHGRRILSLTLFLVLALIISLTTPSLITGNKEIVHIRGSGSTFLQLQLMAWITLFHKVHPSITIEYNGVGSGAGQQQFFEHLTDFCGSDPPLSHKTWLEYKGRILQLPIVLGAVAVIYNIPGLGGHRLRLDGKVLSMIYLGEIKYWDNDCIKRLNPGISSLLPHARIIVVHRSDSSGTTEIFTYYLYRSSNGLWPERLVGKDIEWPVDRTGRGLGGKGNAGVVSIVKNTPYSIGYVELSYAIRYGLDIALLRNRAGYYVEPNTTTIITAGENAARTGLIPIDPTKDFSRELEAIVYSPGKLSYPITCFTHIIIWAKYPPHKAAAIMDFLSWIISSGDKYIIPGYAPLPGQVKEIIVKAVELIKGEG